MADESERLWQGPIRSLRHAQRILNVVAALFAVPGFLIVLGVGGAHLHDPTARLEPLVSGLVLIVAAFALAKYGNVRMANAIVFFSIIMILATLLGAVLMIVAGSGLIALSLLPVIVASVLYFFAGRRAARAARYLRNYRTALASANAAAAETSASVRSVP